jgi:hypothetical protein
MTNAPLGASVFARSSGKQSPGLFSDPPHSTPLAFALDPPRRFARTGGAYRRDVDQEVQWALRPAIGDVHLQGFLAVARRGEFRHGPVQVDQP